MFLLKQSTSGTFKIGPFLDDTDGKTAETALAIAQADVRLSKNGGNYAQKADANACTHDELGEYNCPYNATDTDTLGRLKLIVIETGALPVWHEYMVVTANVYDSWCSTEKQQVDAVEISSDSTAADNLEAMYDGTGYIGGTIKLGVDAVKISGDATAADNCEAMYDGTGYIGGTIKLGVDVDGLNDLSAAQVNAEVDTALNTAIPGSPAAGSVNERVKAIDDKLPSADYISGFADADGGLATAAKADINTQADTALTDYDAPTKAELDSAEADIRGTDNDTLKTLSTQLDSIGIEDQGSNKFVYTVYDETEQVVADVYVRITSDAAGDNTIRRGITNSQGQITKWLDDGGYYFWRDDGVHTFRDPDIEPVP